MKTKVLKSKVNSKGQLVKVEYRYNDMAICEGLFFVIDNESIEMPFESTAMAMFENYIK